MLDLFIKIFGSKDSGKSIRLGAEEKVNQLFNQLGEEIIKIEIGDDLAQYAEYMCTAIEEFRENTMRKNGFILPLTNIIQNKDLQENELIIKVHGNETYHEFVIPTEEYVNKELNNALNVTVNSNLKNLFSNKIIEKYVDSARTGNEYLIYNICNTLTNYEIRDILVTLIENGKSINDIEYIFEKIGEEIFYENKYNRDSKLIAENIIHYL